MFPLDPKSRDTDGTKLITRIPMMTATESATVKIAPRWVMTLVAVNGDGVPQVVADLLSGAPAVTPLL